MTKISSRVKEQEREQELLAALRTVIAELERIAAIRYDERLDYSRIYLALEAGQAALSNFDDEAMVAQTGQRSLCQTIAANGDNCNNYLS